MCILVLSVNQVFVFLGSLGQFGHGAVGSADSSGELNSESRFKIMELVEPR